MSLWSRIKGAGAGEHGAPDADLCPDVDAAIRLLERLGEQPDVAAISHALADALVAEFGFAAASVRLLNPRTRLYEPCAFSGCAPEVLERLSTLDISERELKELYRRSETNGSGYMVPASGSYWREQFGSEDSRVLLFPLAVGPGRSVGYFAGPFLDDQLSPRRLQTLDLVSHLVSTEMHRSRVRSALQQREVEYAVVREQLGESQTFRDNFVANVSHELRTPLTSIKAYAETLLRTAREIEPDIQGEFVQVILKESDRLDQAFADLIDTAHLDGRRRRIARDRFDFMDLVEVVGSEFRPDYEERGVDIRVFGPDTPLDLQGDPGSLRQLLENLLANALKFTPEGGHVRVELHEEFGIARLVVEDDGIGIPSAELRRIFDRFHQVDASATRQYGGQGLGLALCREIVAWHHGRIWAESEGQGSRFIVELPVRGFVSRTDATDTTAYAAERVEWDAFLQMGLQFVSELMQTRVASLMLVDDQSGLLRIEAAVGLEADVVHQTALGQSEGVAGKVWSSGESILVPELDLDPRFRDLANDKDYPERSLLSVPLRRDHKVIGVVNVNSKLDRRAFDPDDQILLEAVAERLARALGGFQYYRRSRRRMTAIEHGVHALLEVGRDRASLVREELARVGTATGRRLGLDEDHVRSIAYALRTYDLGLSAVDIELLRKKAPLTDAERSRVREHTRAGAELMDGLEPSSQVRRIILHHHENSDGSGYPDGLSGEAIPVGARIARLVDTTAAVLQDRPERAALDLASALRLILEGSGREFCPRITPVFLECLEQHADSIQEILCPGTQSRLSEKVLVLSPESAG